MSQRKPLFPQLNRMLHGADYNPEQWIHMPEVWDEDMRLMRLAKCNVMTMGMFSWSSLEPKEGQFEFGWLDEIIDKLTRNGISFILGTPSGARPAWLASKYPEVLRVRPERVRNLYGTRHNHCYTSPVYREKVRIINTLMAERYGGHPDLLLWHISNEYNGECHCDLCQAAFREWLKKKYNDDLDRLNQMWYTTFWSHTYTDWKEIESPSPIGEHMLHGLQLDWKRFVTDQSIDFMLQEIAPLKRLTPDIPVTTNFLGGCNINYEKMAEQVDIVSWDSYPYWHSKDPDWKTACHAAFTHDRYRSFKPDKPFLLMECTPSLANWQEVAKLKRPGMHALSSIQAVAHGSDSVQYFQWRKSRGSSEKFHGAVVDHSAHEHTRVFREVAELGADLERLQPVNGTIIRAETALIYDTENKWVVEGAAGPRKPNLSYDQEVFRHYEPFWKQGIPVDIISMDRSLEGYKLVIAPMLYMLKQGTAERFETFVRSGGTLVLTYWSGIVDENDLCFLGGFPGPLRKLAGVWSEELDALYPEDHNALIMKENALEGLSGSYSVSLMCDLIHVETAKVLAEYQEDFYQGYPALTLNRFIDGEVYYIAARTEPSFLEDFYLVLADRYRLGRALHADWAEGVNAQVRTDGDRAYIFLHNFTNKEQNILLKESVTDLDGTPVDQHLILPAYGYRVFIRDGNDGSNANA
ncbi:beta-galactosidase [Paenibacillus whitsoniae]|uniref:Beta-galactosidase n=1 Tax=Paenibacillus whitsoniae TaxID=2496558 RepID=A0A3S0CTD9_9BACL|nr:beta-galactosidase [Paenibacillus whitsoniae]RTE08259.1 beta-galactosidase [Paenibacillus whitsoniae]